jgi:hypothetical protein
LMKRWDPKMGIVCVFSHNMNLGGRGQKPIGALKSAWIRGEAKPKTFGPCWAVSGLFVAFWAVSGRFVPFRVFPDQFGPIRALDKHLKPITGHAGTIRAISGAFRWFWGASGRPGPFVCILGQFQAVSDHF